MISVGNTSELVMVRAGHKRASARDDWRLGMVRGGVLALVVMCASAVAAKAQTPVERGRYLVDTIMTCHNCHTPRGPNGPKFDKALSGGLRFDEAPFDVTASNITPDLETGIGSWKDDDIKKALREGVRPSGVP